MHRLVITRQHRGLPATVISMTMACAVVGCDKHDGGRLTESPSNGGEATSAWRAGPAQGEPSLRVAIDDGELLAALERATEKARETLDEARDRWQQTPESQQHRWAVKWAAPVRGGGVEHLWVRPMHWSAFRIEGVLLSQPDRPLDLPREQPQRGELVSFAADALSDWLYQRSDNAGDRREGGFTIDVLERTIGPPR